MHKDTANQTQPIIVAVDGSPESASALRWASDRAHALGCGLRIITCYRHQYTSGESMSVSWDHFESTKLSAKALAQEAIESVLGNEAATVDHVLALGPVESVLIDHSRDASMIVLGTRSSYGLRAALRPSATDRITGKARCPVVSIPLEAPVLEGIGL